MIAVDDASGIAKALVRGRQHHVRSCESEAVVLCWSARRHPGRPCLPASAGLGVRQWQSRCRGLALWHAGRTLRRKLRRLLLPVCGSLLLPRGTRSAAAEAGEWWSDRPTDGLGVALILAALRVDVPMLSGSSPATRHGWAQHRVPVHHCDGCAGAVDDGSRGARQPRLAADRSRFPGGKRALRCLLDLALVGNASFLMAVITLVARIAAIAVRIATHQESQQDQQAT